MCSVLEFSSESDKLRTLFSESNHFDSVLFIFDGGRRYKVSSSSLGIHSPQDLLLPLGLGLFRSSPFWSYYLYPQGCNFHKGIDGLLWRGHPTHGFLRVRAELSYFSRPLP